MNWTAVFQRDLWQFVRVTRLDPSGILTNPKLIGARHALEQLVASGKLADFEAFLTHVLHRAALPVIAWIECAVGFL